MKTKSRTGRTVGAFIGLWLALLGLAFLAIPADAHTPSAEASCSGVTATGTGYDAADTNTLGVRIDGGPWTTRTFAGSDSVTIRVPQDGQTHTWEAYVHTTNADPAYSHDYSGSVGPCGAAQPPQPPAETREVPRREEGCALGGVHTWTDVYTTEYVWDEATSSWVLGEETGPVQTDDQFTPYSNAQLRSCVEIAGVQTHPGNHHPPAHQQPVHPAGRPAAQPRARHPVAPAQVQVPTQVESGLSGARAGAGGVDRGLAVAGFGLLTLLAAAVAGRNARARR